MRKTFPQAWLDQLTPRWFPSPERQETKQILHALIRICQQADFYRKHQLQDTFAGRFDVLSLHLAILLATNKQLAEPVAINSRMLVEEFVRNIDLGFRNSGLGDLRVGGKVRGSVAALRETTTKWGSYLSAQTSGDAPEITQETPQEVPYEFLYSVLLFVPVAEHEEAILPQAEVARLHADMLVFADALSEVLILDRPTILQKLTVYQHSR